jgi:predicted alpha/beta superfamily hydrolase
MKKLIRFSHIIMKRKITLPFVCDQTLVLLYAVLMVHSAALSQPKHRIVTVNAIVAAPTAVSDTLTIVGDRLSLGNWNPAVVGMLKVNDTLWSYRDSYYEGETIEFKITLGSWEREAIYTKGEIPPNHRISVYHDTSVSYRIIGWSSKEKSHPAPVRSTITGTVRYHKQMQGESLIPPRDIIVWLPPSYEKESEMRYPVLYMHDGQNIIDPATSFTQIDWGVDETADSLIKNKLIEEIIIVGIYNTVYRSAEYADTDTGRAYARFVVNSLKPFIDSTYRTIPDAENTAIIGSSSGGLSAFLFAWWYPEVFSKAGCFSSAFLSKHKKIVDEVEAYTGPKKPIRFYIDVGGIGLEQRLKPGSDDMAAALRKKGYIDGKDLEYFYDPMAEHNEKAWAARVWRPLIFFFGR